MEVERNRGKLFVMRSVRGLTPKKTSEDGQGKWHDTKDNHRKWSGKSTLLQEAATQQVLAAPHIHMSGGEGHQKDLPK